MLTTARGPTVGLSSGGFDIGTAFEVVVRCCFAGGGGGGGNGSDLATTGGSPIGRDFADGGLNVGRINDQCFGLHGSSRSWESKSRTPREPHSEGNESTPDTNFKMTESNHDPCTIHITVNMRCFHYPSHVAHEHANLNLHGRPSSLVARGRECSWPRWLVAANSSRKPRR